MFRFRFCSLWGLLAGVCRSVSLGLEGPVAQSRVSEPEPTGVRCAGLSR